MRSFIWHQKFWFWCGLARYFWKKCIFHVLKILLYRFFEFQFFSQNVIWLPIVWVQHTEISTSGTQKWPSYSNFKVRLKYRSNLSFYALGNSEPPEDFSPKVFDYKTSPPGTWLPPKPDWKSIFWLVCRFFDPIVKSHLKNTVSLCIGRRFLCN